MTGEGVVDCDVLICGLGPVGQLLAHLLGALGVDVIAIDAASGPYDLPRAAAIDDEVLRILQSVGLDEAVLAQAQVQTGACYVTADGRTVQIVRADNGTLAHPTLATIHQPSLERTLVRALATRPTVRVRWDTALATVTQDGDGVRATLRPNGPATEEASAARAVTARWAVACDGATSPIRTALGVPFGGSTFAQRWLVVDTLVDRPLRRVRQPSFVGDRARPAVSLPMSPGRHRWEWMLRPDEDAAALLTDAGVRRLTAPFLDGERVAVERAVVYVFHARTAARWREGRILLAGDAAHVMPPFAGQGFSSGARDAANLAWKLDAVLRGAPDALLDTYEAERAPHVRAMQQLAVRWGAVVQSTRPRAARLRDTFMRTVDGTALQRWLVDHAKPLPTARTGAFARRPHPLAPLRRTGALFPQPWVTTSGPERVRLDDALPAGWVALALARPPANAGAVAAAGLGAAVPVLQIGEDIHDADGDLTAWLRRAHGATWVILRPDRFVFACGRTSAEADAAITALCRQVGPALS